LHLRVQGSRLNDVLKSISIVACIIIENGKSCPIDSLAWILIGSLLEVFQGFFVVFKSHIAATQDVKGISLSFVSLFCLLDKLK
jgi:hypothetical protein